MKSLSSGFLEDSQSKYNFLMRQIIKKDAIFSAIDLKYMLIFIYSSSEPQLSLVEAPVLAPGEVTIDQAQINEMQGELEQAAQMELPDDDDGF